MNYSHSRRSVSLRWKRHRVGEQGDRREREEEDPVAVEPETSRVKRTLSLRLVKRKSLRDSKKRKKRTSKKSKKKSKTKKKKNTNNDGLQLEQLMDDVQLHVLEFLSPVSARALMSASHRYRNLLQGEKALSYWKHWCHKLWPNCAQDASFVDPLNLPTAAGHFHKDANLSLLLSMARPSPSKIDASLFREHAWFHRDLLHSRIRRDNINNVQLQQDFLQDGTQVVHFNGQVGKGNRCIRANLPLPQPPHTLQKAHTFKGICQGSSIADTRPFVVPHRGRDGHIHLTPRFLSYFEVSIIGQDMPSTDCVAVGLSMEHFPLHSRMPGWDFLSYGYHGDDGGIFHAAGHMLRKYGPTFTAGDTVGCGVDHIVKGIFYTLNGKFLGFAWTHLDLDEALYPTVGIDTNAQISCNFGERPFQFNLASLLQRDGPMIHDLYS